MTMRTILEAKDAEIAKLRAALETTRLYVKDDMIAHAVTLEGMSLIETIDTALEQRMKDETNHAYPVNAHRS